MALAVQGGMARSVAGGRLVEALAREAAEELLELHLGDGELAPGVLLRGLDVLLLDLQIVEEYLQEFLA